MSYSIKKERKVPASFKVDKRVLELAKKKCWKNRVSLSSAIQSLLESYIKS